MLLSNQRFWPLFWTQFLGALNDNYLKNALVVLITFKGVSLLGLSSSQIVAVASAVFILPFVLFSPIAGQLADKLEKSRLVRATKLLELVIMIVAGIGFWFEAYSLLLLVLFLMGTQSTFFGPVKYSIIPELVDKKNLTKGNAYVELGTFLAILIGTIAGGLVVSLEDFLLPLVGGLIVLSMVGIWTSRQLQPVRIGDPSLQIDLNPFPTVKRQWRYLRESTAVFNSALAISWFWFIGAGVLSLLPVYCKEQLNVNEEVVTAFLAMFTIGIAVGSIICEKLSFDRVEIGLVPIGSIGLSIFLIDLSLVQVTWNTSQTLTLEAFLEHTQSWRLLIDFFLMSVSGGIFIVPLYTLLQKRSRAEVRSQIIAGNNIINSSFMVMSSALLMVFYATNLELSHIFLIFALMNVVVAVYIYLVVPEFVLRLLSWVLVHLMYRLRSSGVEHIPEEGPAVMACNHVTYVDWLLISGSCPRPVRFVMHHKFFTIPVLRTLIQQAKVIPICGANEDPELLANAFEAIKQALDEGELICIFPEGALTSDGESSEVRTGILRIIERSPVSVLPMTLDGLWGSIFSKAEGARRIRPLDKFWRRVELIIHQEIPANALDLLKLRAVISVQPPETKNP